MKPSGGSGRSARRSGPGVEVEHPRIVIVGFGLVGIGLTVAAILELPGYGWAGALVTVAGIPWLLDLFCGLIPGIRPLPWGATLALIVIPLFLLDVLGRLFGIMDLSPSGPQLHLMLLVLTAANLGGGWGGFPAFAALVAGMGIIVGRSIAGGTVDGFMPWFAGIPLAYIGGSEVRASGLRAARAAAEHSALLEQAVLDERRRLAREVHDVLAHSLSVIMLHLTAARMAVERNPAAAADALTEAEQVGRASMREIRRSVGLLRGNDDSPTDAALPGLDDLPGLIADMREAGLSIESQLAVRPHSVGPATGLAAYRIVQESLSNAARHAPGEPVQVSVRTADHELLVDVRNRMNGERSDRAAEGVGLVGMRERVQGLGGTVDAGRLDDEWVVTARIPIGVPA